MKMRCICSTPSVSAAGPGCRMIDDFTSCSSRSRTAAIQWLQAFDGTPVAWAHYPLLLRNAEACVRFYAANGLYSKVRNDWSRLTAEQRAATSFSSTGSHDTTRCAFFRHSHSPSAAARGRG